MGIYDALPGVNGQSRQEHYKKRVLLHIVERGGQHF
jgi:hypothetical protein